MPKGWCYIIFMHKKRTTGSYILSFTLLTIVSFLACVSMPFAEEKAQKRSSCVPPEKLKEHMVLIKEGAFGRASAVLYEDDIIISNHTVLEDLGKDEVDVYIAKTGERLKAKKIYSQRKPDIAFLKLEKKVAGIAPLSMPVQFKKTDKITFVSFTLASEFALNHTKAVYLHPTKFIRDSNSYYFEASYKDFSLAGDSGGAYFTCKGQLGGIGFGNFQLIGEDADIIAANIYGINSRAIERALLKAGLSSRRY